MEDKDSAPGQKTDLQKVVSEVRRVVKEGPHLWNIDSKVREEVKVLMKNPDKGKILLDTITEGLQASDPNAWVVNTEAMATELGAPIAMIREAIDRLIAKLRKSKS